MLVEKVAGAIAAIVVVASIVVSSQVGSVAADGGVVVSRPAQPELIQPELIAPEVGMTSQFRRSMVEALRQGVKNGRITRRESLRLRIAMMSPAFRQRAQDLAVVQMVFSGDGAEFIPLDTDGRVDRASIDWTALIDFLERLLPILIELLNLFGA